MPFGHPLREPAQPVREDGSDSRQSRAGASWKRPDQSSGLNRLEERAKVSRANKSRRAVPIRAAYSSDCSSIARAERKSASSASWLRLLGGQLLARRVAGRRAFLGFRRQFGQPFRRGVQSRARVRRSRACSCRASESLSARSRARSASVEIVRFQRGVDVAEGRARRVEPLPRRLLGAEPGQERERDRRDEKQQPNNASDRHVAPRGMDSKGTPPIAPDHG